MNKTNTHSPVSTQEDKQGKTILVLGASSNPARTSHTALNMLTGAGHSVYAIGGRLGEVAGVSIHKDPETLELPAIHTITLYLNAKRQEQYYDYILSLKPERLIFNPGAENPELEKKAAAAGIETVNACTLVMISYGMI